MRLIKSFSFNSYCSEQASSIRWNLLQIFLTPYWRYKGNQPFQTNARSFGNLITDFQGNFCKGILTNQRLLGLQKLDGTFFSTSPIIPYFPFWNFEMTDTKLYNKSIPCKRLSLKHVFLISAEASKTIQARSGFFIFNSP